jgi:hypothetical protein
LINKELSKIYSSFAQAYPYLQLEFLNNPVLHDQFVKYLWRMDGDKTVYSDYKPSINDGWYALFLATATPSLIEHVRSYDIKSKIDAQIQKKYDDENQVEAFYISTIKANPLIDFADWLVTGTKVIVSDAATGIADGLSAAGDALFDAFDRDKLDDYVPATPPSGIPTTKPKIVSPVEPYLPEDVRASAPIVQLPSSPSGSRNLPDTSLDDLIEGIKLQDSILPGKAQKSNSVKQVVPQIVPNKTSQPVTNPIKKSTGKTNSAFGSLPGLS